MTRKSGRHLTLLEREKIMLGIGTGKSYRKLDNELGLSNGTVGHEVRTNRNQNTYEYIAIKAHRKARRREKLQREKAPLKNPEVYLYVKEKLRIFWSPEQIAGRIRIDLPGQRIDDETIYRFIHNSKKHPSENLCIYLPRANKKRKSLAYTKSQKDKIRDRVFISERSPLVHLRTQFGHFETDLVEGIRTDKKVVNVTVERKTRYTKLSLLTSKKAKEKLDSIADQLINLPVISITTDNGSENAYHKQWSMILGCQVYFTNPYHSWEKGTVENTNARLRFFLPKKQSISSLTEKELKLIQDIMNNTPRKCLNYLTPREALTIELKRLEYG